MVVDDNVEFYLNVKDILEQLRGYNVMTAYDGHKALDLMEQKTFDIAIMDIKMPVMNGLETFREEKKVSPAGYAGHYDDCLCR